MKRTTAKLLHDALSAGREIEDYAAGATYDQLLTDRSLQLIFERLFEIIGEAISQADDEDLTLRKQIPEAGDIIGMRNRIAHGYWEVSYKILWDTAIEQVPPMCEAIVRLLDTLPESEESSPRA